MLGARKNGALQRRSTFSSPNPRPDDVMAEFVISPVEDALCLRVGQIVIRWAVVEKLILMLLGTSLIADQGAMFVIANSVSVATQSKWIRILLETHQHQSESLKPVFDLLTRAEDMRQERNEFVHGIWETSECEAGTGLVETVNLDRTEIIRSRLVTTRDLDDLIRDIDSWITDFVSIGRELHFPRNWNDKKSIFS